jgi:hypothetical protein
VAPYKLVYCIILCDRPASSLDKAGKLCTTLYHHQQQQQQQSDQLSCRPSAEVGPKCCCPWARMNDCKPEWVGWAGPNKHWAGQEISFSYFHVPPSLKKIPPLTFRQGRDTKHFTFVCCYQSKVEVPKKTSLKKRRSSKFFFGTVTLELSTCFLYETFSHPPPPFCFLLVV